MRKSEKQLGFDKVNGWGGKRPGAGRLNRSGQVNHMRRPKVSLKTPLHVTLRLKDCLPGIRHKKLLKEWRRLLGMRFRSLIKFNATHWEADSGLDGVLSVPRSWLARVGWMRAGPFSMA